MLWGRERERESKAQKRAEKTHVCQLQNESTNVHMTHKVGQLNFDKKTESCKTEKKKLPSQSELAELAGCEKNLPSQTKHAREKQPTKTNGKYSKRNKGNG